MGEFNPIMTRDGHTLRAYFAAAPGRARGAVVVLQEIFGVNSHIRAVADDYAAEGYTVIAPSLFDRVRRGVELGYSEKEVQEGRGYAAQMELEKTLADLAASIQVVKHSGRVGIVGFCWGGTMSYVAASELPLACAVSYYGGAIVQHLDRKPKCPLLMHFGERDRHIPLEDVERIRAANPQAAIHLYPADHGFNCDQRGSYEPQSAALARTRTLEFLAERLTPAAGAQKQDD